MIPRRSVGGEKERKKVPFPLPPNAWVRRAGGDGGAGRAFALPLFGGPYTGNYVCYDYYPR